ncbi:MAG: spherulation-specific family 4 protein, partial [Candidatus Latescibacteria bacterium]|nr:spherulation-specific family 4 protein [Candidatus Latescibacterota bacterium]
IAAAPRVPLIAILNPASGPGEKGIPDYARAVDSLRTAGGRVIGYVHTSYGQRPLAEVLAEVDAYYQRYALDGIFFDETTGDTTAAHLSYYRACGEYVQKRAPRALVVLNPGTDADQAYLGSASCLLLFENDQASASLLGWQPPAWVSPGRAGQVAVLAYHLPDAAAMAAVLERALGAGAGWLYLTDDTLPNPWDTLPVFWEAQVQALIRFNQPAGEQRPGPGH